MRQVTLFKSLICPEAHERVKKVLESGWIGQGPVVKEFEEAFAGYIGTKYAVATNSGTEALRIAVLSMGLKPGTKVLTTPNTFVSTNHVLLQSGLEPIFCDIDPSNGNIDVESVYYMLRNTPDIKGIMIVHYSGIPVDLEQVYDLAKEYGAKVIEDCAHAAGAEYHKRKIGTNATFACFSFAAVKNLTTGDGGMFLTNDEKIYEKARMISWMGIDKSTASRTTDKVYQWGYNVPYLGTKSNMTDITAAIGVEQLKHLDEWNNHRTKIRNWYVEHSPKGLRFSPEYQDRKSANHFVFLRTLYKTNLVKYLRDNGVQTGFHYRSNLDYPMYEKCKHDTQTGMAEWTSTAISMPTHLYMTEEDVVYITDKIKEFM